jgi:hypothetical protein
MTGSTAIRPRPPASGAFDSRTVAPPVRVDLWEKATARFLVPMRITAAGRSIIGVIGTRRVDQASFCRLSATPHTGTSSRPPDPAPVTTRSPSGCTGGAW